mmetsp:Transcript_5228/g.7570  ORF Transcript_5228/g.7570 Transcript_5228/m.7570 type:complete len:263 (-) Transcript_5228:42-830(-)
MSEQQQPKQQPVSETTKPTAPPVKTPTTVFGMLTPPTTPPRNPLPSPKRQPLPNANVVPSSSTTGLNSNLAKSMEAKLNDAEINAIIAITKNLRQTEYEVKTLQNHNADLQNKIDGTEAVKEFLVEKVRDMEESLTQAVTKRNRWDEQIGADQEVITYLDSRVQQLEQNERRLLSGNQRFQERLSKTKTQAEAKINMLTDMLKYERDKGHEAERDWRATRRVLKKEVKQSRKALQTLQQERDSLRNNNQQLQAVLLSSTMVK